MRISKVLCFVIAALVLVTTFAGCGGSKTSENTAAATSTVEQATTTQSEQLPRPEGYDVRKELQDYKEVMALTGYYNTSGVKDEDNFSRQWVRENLKIDFQITYVAGENYDDKVRAMSAVDELPGVLLTYSRGLFDELANNDRLLDLDDLLKNYVPQAKKWYNPLIQDMMRYKDGKLYTLIGGNLPIGDRELQKKYWGFVGPYAGMFVNTNMQKAVNMEAPKTPDELYNYLKAAVALPPINGKKIIGLESPTFCANAYQNTGYPNTPSGGLVHMFGQFSSDQTWEPDDVNQIMKFVYDNPAYVKFLKFFSKLYNEGLMDKDAFILNNQDAVVAKAKEGRIAWIVSTNISDINSALSKDIMKPFFPVDYPRDPSVTKINYVSVNPVGGYYFALTKKLKDPVRTAKFIEWHLSDEGLIFNNYGPPDKTKQKNTWWYDESQKPDNGLNLPYKPVLDLDLQQKWDKEKPGWEYEIGTWGMSALGLRLQMNYYKPGEFGVCMADDLWKKLDEIYNNENNVYSPSDLKMIKFANAPAGDIFKQKSTKLNDLLNKWEVKIIISAKSDAQVDSMFAQMMQEARKAGYDDIAKEAYQTYININK